MNIVMRIWDLKFIKRHYVLTISVMKSRVSSAFLNIYILIVKTRWGKGNFVLTNFVNARLDLGDERGYKDVYLFDYHYANDSSVMPSVRVLQHVKILFP